LVEVFGDRFLAPALVGVQVKDLRDDRRLLGDRDQRDAALGRVAAVAFREGL